MSGYFNPFSGLLLNVVEAIPGRTSCEDFSKPMAAQVLSNGRPSLSRDPAQNGTETIKYSVKSSWSALAMWWTLTARFHLPKLLFHDREKR